MNKGFNRPFSLMKHCQCEEKDIWKIKGIENESEACEISHLSRIVQTFEIVTTNAKIQRYLEETDFIYQRKDKILCFIVYEKMIRISSDFEAIYETDSRLEGISVMRRDQRWE
jgi:hypothetical protein